ncbi:flagellar basal body P-ring formation chaperone FlgA [Shimia sp. SDUM112013]|uniref:flagellar basal body P-ring formation chaperone FlgA n=1 Tax=Shimia sp. SDUM112013 TaxID=3136160 RepID=UPI0032ED42A6
MFRGLATFLIFPTLCWGDTVVPTRTIRPMTLIEPAFVTLSPTDTQGTYSSLQDVIGLEARVALYPGRAIRHGDVGPAAIVERNKIVLLVFTNGGLKIFTEGRSLERAGTGERIRALNLESRVPVYGVVQPDGSILVTK